MGSQAVPQVPPCVILYGTSLFLAGIRAELGACAHLDLLTIEVEKPDAAAIIRERRPAAVLFDLGSAQADFAVTLLREQSGLILIGVDPSSDTLLVLSSRHEQPVSVGDLVQMLVGGPACVPPSPTAALPSRTVAPQ